MTRTKRSVVTTLATLVLATAGANAQAGWGVGVRIGGPVYYRSWDPYYYPYYSYRPVYVAPPPVIVEPAPVVLPPPPAPVPLAVQLTAAPQPISQPPAPLPASVLRAQAPEASPAEISYHLQQLRDADERVRANSVLQLGRLKAQSTVDALAATLAGDRSPMVREAAARALGLLGSPKALPALQHAALADADRDVRHSAQFAVDVVQSGR